MSETNAPELLSINDAAQLLKVHPNTLRIWGKNGTLKAIRFGKRGDRKYRKDELLKLLNKQS